MDFSATSYDQVMLRFNQFYDDYSGDDDTGFVYVYDGSLWNAVDTLVGQDYGSTSTPDFYEKDITSWANGNSGVQVAFKYVGNDNFYCWYVDSVVVAGVTLAANDVMTSSINSPTFAIEGYNWGVQTTVYNNGTATNTFDDSTFIDAVNKVQFFYENFSSPQGWDGSNPPVNVAGTWAIIDSGDGGDGWNNNDWHAYYYSSWGDTVARVHYTPSPSEAMNEWLITPAIDGSAKSNSHLAFNTFFNWEGTTDTAYILGTTNDWTTTHEIARWHTDHGNYGDFASEDFDISSWADGSSTIKIAFKYIGDYDLYWYVDDVELYEYSTTNDYTSAETVTNLTSLESRDIDYTATWNDPDPGDYIITSFTALSTDTDLSNDTLTAGVTSHPHFGSGGPDAGRLL
jgi:hypothetical protein